MVLSFQTKTDRRMAYLAIALLSLGGLYGAVSFGLPVYWRFYATVIRPFEAHDTSSGTVQVKDKTFEKISPKVLSPPRLPPKEEPPKQQSKVATAKKPFDVNDFPLNK